MNNDQETRYAEVLNGFSASDFYEESMILYVATGGKKIGETFRIPTVCPVICAYAVFLNRLLGQELALEALWKSNEMQAVFGTENKGLVVRRALMMAKFYENCMRRAAGALPAGPSDGSAREEAAFAQVLSQGGASAAGMAIGMLCSAARPETKFPLPGITADVFAANDALVKVYDELIGSRRYKLEAIDKGLLGELSRGSIWLLREMSAMKAA